MMLINYSISIDYCSHTSKTKFLEKKTNYLDTVLSVHFNILPGRALCPEDFQGYVYKPLLFSNFFLHSYYL